jgi:hypothetical protein
MKVKLPAAAARCAGGPRAQLMADAIVSDLVLCDATAHPLTAIVYEWPQVYRAARAPGDPNDLLGLVAVAAAVASKLGTINEFAHRAAIDIFDPTPADWSQGLPKALTGDPWKSVRGVRVSSRLSPAELALVPRPMLGASLAAAAGVEAAASIVSSDGAGVAGGPGSASFASDGTAAAAATARSPASTASISALHAARRSAGGALVSCIRATIDSTVSFTSASI